MLVALKKELKIRKNYLENQQIKTIYFGGGTPSLLSVGEVEDVLEEVYKHYTIVDEAEITLEANPDDLTGKYIADLGKTRINRLSIGCQSFNDKDLMFLQRRHNSKQSEWAVTEARKSGFDNISIDLIYGLQHQHQKSWRETIRKGISLEIQHISAYHLTIEPKTPFDRLLKKGKIQELEEQKSNELFELLIEETKNTGFIHYEISSFARPGYFSVHNSNYWKQETYLGIGPSAHSYNGNTRQWNTTNNTRYIEKMQNNKPVFTIEKLSYSGKYNDYILTSLRTMWGIDLEYLETQFSKELLDYCMNLARKYLDYGLLKQDNNHLILTEQGKFVSDNIISELLFVDKENNYRHGGDTEL